MFIINSFSANAFYLYLYDLTMQPNNNTSSLSSFDCDCTFANQNALFLSVSFNTSLSQGRSYELERFSTNNNISPSIDNSVVYFTQFTHG